MKIAAIELRRLLLPLVAPFETSAGVETAKDVLLVRAISPDCEGWGECAALARPTYTAEYVDGAQAVVRGFLAPLLLAAGDVTAAEVGPALAVVKGHPMAKGALEMAVLDAELRAAGMSFAAYFGAVRDRVPAGVAVGVAPSLADLLATVEAHLDAGYPRIKLKIRPGWDVDPVRAVRERFGDGFMLQVDANGAYTLADAAHLARLDPFGLVLIEQPLPEDDLRGHAELAARIATPICLDESITSARVAAEAIAGGACRVISIKAGRVGGYLEARKVAAVCAANGVPAWCGGMLETGVGRAANVALAAGAEFTLPGDLSASDRYFDRDVTTPFVLEDGHLRVPTRPGIGVEVDREVLRAVTTGVELLER